jgi:hypothetical protein
VPSGCKNGSIVVFFFLNCLFWLDGLLPLGDDTADFLAEICEKSNGVVDCKKF